MLKTKAIRYLFLGSFQTLIASTISLVIFLFLQPRSIYFKHRTATFSTAPRFTRAQRTRRPVPAAVTLTALAAARTLWKMKTATWRKTECRWRTKTQTASQRQYRTVNTNAFKQTAQQKQTYRPHNNSLALAAFNVLKPVLYIFVFPPSLLCLLMHATSFFCSAYKPFFWFTTSLFVFLHF